MEAIRVFQYLFFLVFKSKDNTCMKKLTSGALPGKGSRGSRGSPPPSILAVILSQQDCNELSIPEIVRFVFAYNKYSKSHCGICLRFSTLFNLLPELVAVGDRNPDIEAALEFYENDLASPHVADVELL